MEEYAVQMEIPVAWGDMDAFGHVNNTVYFKYFETLRIFYFSELGYMKLMEDDNLGPILADAYCRFRLPVKFPDTLVGGIRVSKLASDRMWMKFSLWSKAHGKLAAEGNGVVVSFDYNVGTKAPIQASVMQQVLKIEKIAPERI